MKTASQMVKSPMNDKPSSVFTMSKTLQQQQQSHEDENLYTPKADATNSLTKSKSSGRVNVINFSMNRQKAPALTLGNITNSEYL